MFFVGCVIETVGADSTSALGSQHLSELTEAAGNDVSACAGVPRITRMLGSSQRKKTTLFDD